MGEASGLSKTSILKRDKIEAVIQINHSSRSKDSINGKEQIRAETYVILRVTRQLLQNLTMNYRYDLCMGVKNILCGILKRLCTMKKNN